MIRFVLLVLVTICIAACNSSSSTPRPTGAVPSTLTPRSSANAASSPTMTTTPAPLDFTATALVADATETGSAANANAASQPTLTGTPADFEITATALVAAATRSARTQTNRTPEATIISVQPLSVPENCAPGEFNSFDQSLSNQIQTVIDAAGLKDTTVSVLTTEETQDCVETTVIRSQFTINTTMMQLEDEAVLAERTAQILEAMQAFTPDFAPGIEPAVLSLRFDRGDEQRILETQYRMARQAYERGLRGNDLLQAMGGLRDS